MIDNTSARLAYEAFIAKALPGDGPADPWQCFRAGYLFGVIETGRGTVRALAALKGEALPDLESLPLPAGEVGPHRPSRPIPAVGARG